MLNILIQLLKRFEEDTTVGEIIKLHENGDIDLQVFINDFLELERE